MNTLSRSFSAAALAIALIASVAGVSYADSNEAIPMNRADSSELAGRPQPVHGSWSYTFASWDNGGLFGALPDVKVLNGPAHGSVSLTKGSLASDSNILGTELTYVPAKNFHGSDSITYEVSLQRSDKSFATVTNTYTVQLNVQ